jgi:hypothetical protein
MLISEEYFRSATFIFEGVSMMAEVIGFSVSDISGICLKQPKKKENSIFKKN